MVMEFNLKVLIIFDNKNETSEKKNRVLGSNYFKVLKVSCSGLFLNYIRNKGVYF